MPQDLIGMVNQIAQFFESYPKPDGIAEIAKHLQNFWDPKMRHQILASTADGDLHPLAREALKRVSDGPAGGGGLLDATHDVGAQAP